MKDVVFTDIGALEAAVAELKAKGVKCDLIKGGTPRAYFSNQQGMGAADYVLKLHDSPYDVGFYQDASVKGMVARTDLYGNHIAGLLGAPALNGESPQQAALGKLYQTYAIHATTRQAAKQGYSVRRNVKADGTVTLILGNVK